MLVRWLKVTWRAMWLLVLVALLLSYPDNGVDVWSGPEARRHGALGANHVGGVVANNSHGSCLVEGHRQP